MATETDVRNGIDDAVDLLEEADKFARSNAKNVATMIDAAHQTLRGDDTEQVANGLQSFRNSFAGLLSPSGIRSLLDGWWLEYGKVKGYPERRAVDILARLQREFGETPTEIQTRAFSFASMVASGSPVGDGGVFRVTTDRWGYPLENATAELKTLECVADRFTGRQSQQESYDLYGEETPKDAIAGFRSASRRTTLTGLSAEDSERFLSNPSFAQAKSGTTLPGWDIDSGEANITTETTLFYRGSRREGDSPQSIQISGGDAAISQSLEDQTLPTDRPLYVHVAVHRVASATGTVTLRIGGAGGTVVTLDVSTLTADTWGVLRFPVTAAAWYESFKADALKLEIFTTTLSGAILLDDVTMAPYVEWDGTFWAFVNGETESIVGDKYTGTDTETGSKLQKWISRGYDTYLPASGVPDWSDP